MLICFSKNNPQLFNLDEQEVQNIKSSMDVINVKTIEEIDKRYDFILFSTVRSNKEVNLIVCMATKYDPCSSKGKTWKFERSKKTQCSTFKGK